MSGWTPGTGARVGGFGLISPLPGALPRPRLAMTPAQVAYRARLRMLRAGGRRTAMGRYVGRPSRELKFHDVTFDPAPAVGGAFSSSLCIIGQGITESTRIGRKCVIRSIGWKGAMTLNPATSGGGTSDVVRMMLILDRQANGAVPVVLDVLETAIWDSWNNLANSKRFKTLWNKVIVLNAMSGSGIGVEDTRLFGERTVLFKYWKKVNVVMEYSGATGAVGEIRSNNLIILTISSSALTAVQSKIRLRFSDS